MSEYIYETVRVHLASGLLAMKETEDYRQIIVKYAAQGWRFKQAFAPPVFGHGVARYIDLIFEKKVEE